MKENVLFVLHIRGDIKWLEVSQEVLATCSITLIAHSQILFRKDYAHQISTIAKPSYFSPTSCQIQLMQYWE